ncbi:hypothetical protein JCM11641_005373 [Rhodosporidiobolus odoratus]
MVDTPMADPNPELVVDTDFDQALSTYGPPHLTPLLPPPPHLQALAQRSALLASWHRGPAQSDSCTLPLPLAPSPVLTGLTDFSPPPPILFQQLVLFTYNVCQYVTRAPQTLAEAALADTTVNAITTDFEPEGETRTTAPLLQDLQHILRNSAQGQTLVVQPPTVNIPASTGNSSRSDSTPSDAAPAPISKSDSDSDSDLSSPLPTLTPSPRRSSRFLRAATYSPSAHDTFFTAQRSLRRSARFT